MKNSKMVLAFCAVIVLVIAAAGLYKFNYLSGKSGYDVDGNKMQEKSISESKEATKNNIEIFKIAPQTQKCTGVVEMDCLVVNGELFYDSIDGFEFENGYNYELEVEKKQLCDSKNPSECPQDKGMYQYTLKKVLKKEKN